VANYYIMLVVIASKQVLESRAQWVKVHPANRFVHSVLKASSNQAWIKIKSTWFTLLYSLILIFCFLIQFINPTLILGKCLHER
jgi:hypothetical protein